MNSNSPWAFVLTAAFPTIAALIGILVNNGRFNDLSKRIDDMSGRIEGVNSSLSKRIDDMSGHIEGVNRSLSQRIDDLHGNLSNRMDDLAANLSKRMDDLAANMMQHRNQIHSDIQMLIGWERERDKR